MAHDAGHLCDHANFLGLSGQKDWQLLAKILAEDYTFVTNNRGDFSALYAQLVNRGFCGFGYEVRYRRDQGSIGLVGGFRGEEHESCSGFGVSPGERAGGAGVAVGGGRTGSPEVTQAPAEAPGLFVIRSLVGDHLLRGTGSPDRGSRTLKHRQKLRDILYVRVRAAPGCAEIAPVGAVPIPIASFGNLTDGGVLDAAAAEPERGVRHAKRPEDFPAEEFAKRDARDSLRDGGCEQDSHALVPDFCPGPKEEGRLQRQIYEVLERSMPFPKLHIFRKHVGQA